MCRVTNGTNERACQGRGERYSSAMRKRKTAPERAVILDEYKTRWLRWVYSGLAGLDVLVSRPTGLPVR